MKVNQNMKIRPNYKILAFLLLLGLAGCSQIETGIVIDKSKGIMKVRPIQDTNNLRTMDWGLLLEDAKILHGGIITTTSRLNNKYLYTMIMVGDVITYKKPKEQDNIVLLNSSSIKKVNGIKKSDFLARTR